MAMGGHIHVAGVGGVGMSALAQALTWTYGRVTGSDRDLDRGLALPVFDALRAAGVELVPQDGSAVEAGTEAVVYSTAVERENPDMTAARSHGVPLRHRAAVLAELAGGHRVLAVAGTAGKTTTTAMLGWTLEQLGANPTVVNGGALVDWSGDGRVGNVRRGAPDAPWVLEVDESDRSLLEFHPEWSILTNISQDHFTLEEVRELFRAYARQVRHGLVCGAGVAEILQGPGLSAEVVEAADTGMPTAATVGADGVDEGTQTEWRGQQLTVRQPGAHNACNALLAAELCARLGYEPAAVAEAMAHFGGVRRRLERVDDGRGIRVLDDYAHNPAKIAAAWSAVASPKNRVLAVWRPHGFKPLHDLMEPLTTEFTRICRPQDRLWILPVYYAGGTVDRRMDSDVLVERLAVAGCGGRVAWAESPGAVIAAVAAEARSGDTVLVMGARDPQLPALARELAVATRGRG